MMRLWCEVRPTACLTGLDELDYPPRQTFMRESRCRSQPGTDDRQLPDLKFILDLLRGLHRFGAVLDRTK